MLVRCHWLAASGSQGKPVMNQVRVHSTRTQAPARPSWASIRTGAERPCSRGMVHQTARYQQPTQAPTKGPRRRSPKNVTCRSQQSRTIQATAWAANIVQQKTLSGGREKAQKMAGEAKA